MRYVLILALLAGCATPEQQAANMKRYGDNVYGPQCEGLGFQKDTPDYRYCMVQLHVGNRPSK